MRRSWVDVALVLLLALAARGFYLLLVGPQVFDDGVHYATLARNLAHGLGYTYMGAYHLRFPPGYPLVMLFFSKLGLDFLWAGVAASFAFGALVPVLVYLLTEELFGRREALFSGLAAALAWPLVFNSTTTHSEPIAHLFALAGLWLGLKAYKAKPWLFAPSGALLGLAYLTRPEDAVLLLPALVLAVLRRKFRIPSAAAALAGFLLAASPYWAATYRATEKFQLSGKLGYTLHEQEVVSGASPERVKRIFGLAPGDTMTYTQLLTMQGYGLWDYIKENPSAYFRIVRRNFLKLAFFFLHPAYAGLFFPLMLLGFLDSERRRRALAWGAVPLLSLLPYLLIVVPFRALALPLCLGLPLAGLGFVRFRKLGAAALAGASLVFLWELGLWWKVKAEASWNLLKAASELVRGSGMKRLLVWESSSETPKVRLLGLEPAPRYPAPMRFLAVYRGGAEAHGLPLADSLSQIWRYMDHRGIQGLLIIYDPEDKSLPPFPQLVNPEAQPKGFRLEGYIPASPSVLLWRKISP